MRFQLRGATSKYKSSTNLLNHEDRKIPDVDDEISLKASLCQIVTSLEKLIDKVYRHTEAINSHGDSWLCIHLILAPRN